MTWDSGAVANTAEWDSPVFGADKLGPHTGGGGLIKFQRLSV